MNRVDGVVEIVGCNQRFHLLVAWISSLPCRGLAGAAVSTYGSRSRQERGQRRPWSNWSFVRDWIVGRDMLCAGSEIWKGEQEDSTRCFMARAKQWQQQFKMRLQFLAQRLPRSCGF